MQTIAAIENQLQKAHGLIEKIFRNILPKYGLGVREAQIQLTHDMLDALHGRRIALADAGVGIGKTYAYLIAAIAHHLYLPESIWVRTSYRHDPKFNMNTPMPVIISTSSIALQKAIVHEYIPFLSQVLLENKVIDKALRYVVRKGKGNYVCDKLLRLRLESANLEKKNPTQREALLLLSSIIDLDMVEGLSAFDRKQVCVPTYCSRNCNEASKCRYQRLLRSAKSPDVFFQICNHNYLLADMRHRKDGKEPLLPNYKAVIIDEAHKLHNAAQQMYGQVLSKDDVTLLVNQAGMAGIKVKRFAGDLLHLQSVNNRFFAALSSSVTIDPDEDVQQYEYAPVKDLMVKLFKVILALKVILEEIQSHGFATLENRLDAMKERLYLFYNHDSEYIRYMEYIAESKSMSLCAVPKNLKKQLSNDLWSMPVPFLLTSGTLAVNDSFDRIRAVSGMESSLIQKRISEFTALSPFDYKKNCLLYLPDDLLTPDIDNPDYLDAVAQKIVDLVQATYGHTLVLFTSYKMMFQVCDRVQKQSLAYPVMAVWRNSNNIVDVFKKVENAVLFATGACWEGIDFPGDMVSSLIIVTLPFNVPDQLSKYEQSQYPSLSDFISASVVPDMQRKLKQGFGRAIRTVTDSCVVSILDARARDGGKYHQVVLDALPVCRITDQITTVAEFIRQIKPQRYFQCEEKKYDSDRV